MDLNREKLQKILGRKGRRSGDKGLRGKGRNDLNRGGGKDLREDREKIWGQNALRGKGGKRSLGGKGKSFSGGTGPKGQWGDRISNGKGGNRLWEEKGGDLGGKRP